MDSSRNETTHDAQINWWVWSVVSATVVGFTLRVFRLHTQFPTGDEWHAMIVGTNYGFLAILTSFFDGAHSIPEALYYRTLANLGSFTEVGIYAPFVLAGTVTIGLVPFLTRDFIGRRASALLAWFIALAPFLILYSRFARPYGIVATLSLLSIYSLVRWDRTRLSRYLVGYGLSASLAAYFHVIAFPFVVTPIVFLLFRDIVLVRAGVAESMRNAFLATLSIGIPTAVLLGAAAWQSYGGVTTKLAQGALTTRSALDGYMVLIGSQELAVGVVAAGLGFLGIWSLTIDKQSRLFSALLLTCSAAQLVTVVLLQPLAVEAPHVFARYLIPVALPLIIFIAAGFEYAARRMPSILSIGVAAVMLIAYFGHTSAWILTRYSTQTDLYILGKLIFGRPFERIPLDNFPQKIPAFYEMLSHKEPGEFTVVESPFRIDEYALILYQLVHRQRVLAGITDSLCGSGNELMSSVFRTYGRTQLKNIVDIGDKLSLREKGVDFVVFHRSIADATGFPYPAFVDANVSGCIDHFLDDFGPAVFDDGNMIAFSIKERHPANPRPTELD